MNLQNTAAAFVHNQMGQALEGLLRNGAIDHLFNIDVNPGESLLGQLTGPGDGPPKISIGFGLDILGTPFSALLNALPVADGSPFALLRGGALTALRSRIKDAVGGRLSLFDNQGDVIAKLVAAQGPTDLREVADDLFGGLRGAFGGPGQVDALNSVKRLRQLLGSDIGVALPLATLINAVQRAGRNAAEIPNSVEQGLLAYFFKANGFLTVDGETVIAPVHISDVKQAVAGAVEQRDLGALQLRGLFSKTTADRYLRDIIRIIVESVYDAGRGLKEPENRFASVVSDLRARGSASKTADAIEEQFVTWFRGFSSMAESAAMRAVEVGTQGVSEFQTNPLIAASAGSFAGTVARKLAQDSFLAKLRIDLDNR